jgi:hypothetical protein
VSKAYTAWARFRSQIARLSATILFTFIYVASFVALIVGYFVGVDVNPVIYGTLSLLEIVWITINAWGVFYSLGNYISSSIELEITLSVTPVNRYELLSALQGRRIDAVVLIKQVTYLAVGLLAAFTPPPVVRQVQSLAMIVAAQVFIGGSLMLFYLSYTLRQDRVAFRDGSGRSFLVTHSESHSDAPVPDWYGDTGAGGNGPELAAGAQSEADNP